MKKFLILLPLTLSLLSCQHHKTQSGKLSLSKNEENILYEKIRKEVVAARAKTLTECNCMKAFHRDYSKNPDNTSRYAFDRAVGKHGVLTSQDKKTVSIFSTGPGTLLNELTAFSYLLALGKDLKIYLSDWAYIFYEVKGFERKAVEMAENPELIPEGWKEFYFWGFQTEEDPDEPFLPFFERHHKAIDEFKAVLNRLADHYGRKVSIEIVLPPKTASTRLPPVDLILSIDSFMALPNIMWMLFYRTPLGSQKARFVGLIKNKPLGGFWDSEKKEDRHLVAKKSVSVQVFDVTGDQKFGSYTLVEKQEFKPTVSQINEAINFKENPEIETTQSVFDFLEE